MATLAATVTAIRRLLKDEPTKLQLDGALSDTTTETVTVNSGETSKLAVGTRLEHDDATGEQRRVLSITSTTQFTAERGYNGSTAATHSDNTYLLVAPRFPFDEIDQAIDVVIDSVLYGEGVYDVIERQLASSASSDHYNAPASTIEEILHVYQKPASVQEPINVTGFDPLPTNRDTSLFASGKSLHIWENAGTAGTDVYYLSCKEKYTLSTLSTTAERIVQFLACALLVEWEVPRRLAGPTNQGDRTVASRDFLGAAAYYREQANRLIRIERSNLRELHPLKFNWRY